MFRIGLLGSENSHADAFASIFNGYNKDYVGEFDDIRVVATYSTYEGVDEKLAAKFGIELIAKSPEEMLGKIDAAVVTARDGRTHAALARPFIEAGIPVFIDKPFTQDEDEAIELARLARDKGVPLVGGSSLKLCPDTKAAIRFVEDLRKKEIPIIGGTVMAPVNLVNQYGGFFFYASHLAEICLPVFGYYPQWVAASETQHGVSLIIHYDDFDVSGLYTGSRWEYEVQVFTPEELDKTKPDNKNLSQMISLDMGLIEEAREIARMLRTGRMEYTYEELIQPVMFLNAVYRAMKSGKREEIRIAEL